MTSAVPETAPNSSPSKHARRRPTGRGIAALLVFALACLLTAPALIGHWAHRTVVDTGRFLDTVEPLAKSPAVQDAVAALVTEAIIEKVDTQQVVDDFLGTLLGGLGQAMGGDGSRGEAAASALSGPIAAGINGAIGTAVDNFLASEEFAALWDRFMEATHVSLIALLEGKDQGVVQTEGDAIVLDVQTVIDGVKEALVDRGITVVENIEVTTSEQIVLAEVPGLTQVQFAYRAANPLLAYLPLLLIALFGVAILLARNRSRMVLATGIALIAETFVALAALRYGEQRFVDAFAGTVLEPASTVFWQTLLRYLIDGMQALLLLGVLVALAGWFAGRSRPASLMRAHLVRGLHEVGASVELPGAAFVARHRTLKRTGAVVIVLVIFAFSDVMSLATVVWSALLLALLFTLIEIWIGSAERETVEIEIEVVEIDEPAR